MAVQKERNEIISNKGTARNVILGSSSLRRIQWVIVAAIFCFLGRMVWQNWIQIKEAHFTFRISLLLVSSLFFMGGYFLQIWAWYLITVKLGVALRFRETVESWVYSQLGKYLPGKVWLLLGRFHFYASRGKPGGETALALYFEAIVNVTAAGILFLCCLIPMRAMHLEVQGFSWWVGLFFPLAFVLIHPRVLQKMLNWILNRLKIDLIHLSISYTDVLRVLLVSLLAWISGGVSFYLFVCSVFPVSPSHIFLLMGALAVSCVLGLAVLFVPGGLGVREGVLVLILSHTMPVSVAVVISILTRLWMTFIEMGVTGTVYLLERSRKQR